MKFDPNLTWNKASELQQKDGFVTAEEIRKADEALSLYLKPCGSATATFENLG